MSARPLPRAEPSEVDAGAPKAPTWRSELVTTGLVGLAAGLFGGVIGVGGGVIMIMLMVGVTKLTQHQAHGTSVVALVFTGVAGALPYALKGAVDVPAALALAAPAVLTAHYGARFAHALAEWKLRRSFGGFLVFVSLLLLFKNRLPGLSHPAAGWAGLAVLVVVGALTGFLSGMMGIGGGSLMVSAMVLLAGFGQYVAQGTSLLAMVPTGAAAARAHWRLGNVVKRMLPGFIPGIIVGAFLGGCLAGVLDEHTLRLLFSGILVWTGVRFLRARRPLVPLQQ
jgi:uncharacterized membrane protein YfcA